MPIKSGIGFGEAQVYNTGNLTNLYGKLLQQQAKDEAQFATDLGNVMAKYSTKGLKEDDIKLTAQAYQQIKDKVSKYSTRNPVERAKALSDARNGIQSIQEYADSAVNAYKTLDQIAPDIQSNPWKYKQGTLDAVTKLYQLPYNKWGDDFKTISQTTFQKEPDTSSVYKMFNGVNADLSKMAPNYKGRETVEGSNIKTMYNVPESEALKNLYTTMELNPEAKYTLTHLYEKANPGKEYTSADVANFGLGLYKQQYGDNALNFFGGKQRIPKETGGGDSDEKLTYRQKLITGLINQDEDSRQELEANLPSNAKVTYLTSKSVPGVSKGGYKMMRIVIPAESSENGLEVVETIPLQSGKPLFKLNSIINAYGPEKVSPSKVGITGGKPRGEKFEVNTSNEKLPTVTSQAEYNKLKTGQRYLDADGVPHKKQ